MGQCYITRRGTKTNEITEQLGIYPTGTDGRPCGNVTVIDGTMTLSDYVFRNNTGVIGIALPDSLYSLNDYAFAGCTNLQQLILPKDIDTISSYCFDGCTGLCKIKLPKNLTTINDYAFQNCTSLRDIQLDDTITKLCVKGYAFKNCSNLSNDVITKIATKADGTLFAYAFANLTRITNVTTNYAVNYCFANCTNLNKITILKTLNTGGFGQYVFQNCPNLQEVVLPDNATLINQNMFNNNSSLQKVNLPDSLETIEQQAFYQCSKLTFESNIMPQELVTIGNKAFQLAFKNNKISDFTLTFNNAKELTFQDYSFADSGIKKVVFNGDNDIVLGSRVFTNSTLESIDLNNFNHYIKFLKNTNSWTDSNQSSWIFEGTKLNNQDVENFLSKITLGNIKNAVPNSLFKSCQHLTDLNIPCLACGYEFDNCKNLKTVTFREITEENLLPLRKEIGSYCFQNCTSLTEVNFSNDITTVNEAPFQNTPKLKNINIDPDGVALQLNQSAFANSQGLEKVILPINVVNLQNYAVGNNNNQYYSNIKEIFLLNPNVTTTADAFRMNYRNVQPTCYYTGNKPTGTTNAPKYFLVERISENICWWLENTSELAMEGIGETINYVDNFNTILSEAGIEKNENDFTISVVTSLPTDNFDETVIYRIKNSDKTMFTDYIVVNDELKEIRTLPTFDKNIITKVTVREGRITALGDNLFKDCQNLKYVDIPNTITSIGTDTFTNCSDDLTFICNENSVAHLYAQEHNIKCMLWEQQQIDTYGYMTPPSFS